MFKLPSNLSEVPFDKATCAAHAEQIAAGIQAEPKEVWAAAARRTVFEAIRGQIAAELAERYETHTAIYGDAEGQPDADWLEAWHAEVRTGFEGIAPEVLDELVIDAPVWVVGMVDEVAGAVAEAVMPMFEPHPDHPGKYLSALGVVASDYQTAAASVAPPKAPTPAAKAAPPAPPHDTAAPTEDEIKRAFATMQGAIDMRPADMGGKIGVSKGTWSNYIAGRTVPKLDRRTAQVLRVEMDQRAAMLHEAAEIFARVI